MKQALGKNGHLPAFPVNFTAAVPKTEVLERPLSTKQPALRAEAV
jgi:hypothetical protein